MIKNYRNAQWSFDFLVAELARVSVFRWNSSDEITESLGGFRYDHTPLHGSAG